MIVSVVFPLCRPRPRFLLHERYRIQSFFNEEFVPFGSPAQPSSEVKHLSLPQNPFPSVKRRLDHRSVRFDGLFSLNSSRVGGLIESSGGSLVLASNVM